MRRPIKQIWGYKDDIIKLKKMKEIKEDGEVESDPEVLRKILRKIEGTQDIISTDAKRLLRGIK